MKKETGIAQLFLRVALGIGFILPVLDRLGLLGMPGTGKVNWGDWEHFVSYTHSLVPYVGRSLANLLAGVATVAEVAFGICLPLGYQVKAMALGAAILTFIFGICMATTAGIAAPFNYPVFVFTGAALLLSERRNFGWSLDQVRKKKPKKGQTIPKQPTLQGAPDRRLPAGFPGR
jgi:uncharacterized membrane protein YphA (DoxX/SURF4 family)